MSVAQTVSAQGRKPTGLLGWITALTMPVLFRSLYAKVARMLDLKSEDEVLDVACGSGAFLRKYATHARRIAGIDHAEIQIQLARRWNRDRIAAGTAEFVTGDATALPWTDGTFSAVTCNCVHCFAEPERSLDEMRRVLRPGGRAVVVMQAGAHGQPGQVDRWGIPQWSEDEVRRMLATAGFSDVSVYAADNLWFAEARTH